MTDELQELREKLAIAEELIKGSNSSWVCNLGDVSLRWSHDAATKRKEYTAQRTTNHGTYISGGGPDLAISECPIDCIRQARQKLAAERAEAAKSEREKRLEAVARDLVQWFDAPFGMPARSSIQDIANIARQALES